jgi:hypothetical protein
LKAPVLIGNGQGFWGDSVDAPVRLVEGGPLHYLTLDYLAEVTMSIMQRQRDKDPGAGYARDFPALMARVFPTIRERGIRVLSNAGGVNPAACRDAVLEAASRAGVRGARVAIVEGDDILDRLDDLAADGVGLENMETGEPLATVRDRVLSANVYLSTFAMVEALDTGADLVITGRATDPGLVLAPMIHEFGWGAGDWDRLAAGTVAGHIVECGAQCTGGNFSRWWEVPDYAGIGYPIAAAHPDGTFEITKHEGTGGIVTVPTVSEQLLYEMGEPTRYITPDCIVDFTSIRLEQAGADRVRVSGVRGQPATDTFKVSISYSRGFMASGTLTVSGPNALEKSRLVADIIWKRLEAAGCAFEETSTEFLGVNSSHGEIVAVPDDPGEVVVRIGVKDPDRTRVERFGKEIAPVITSGPPGVTGFAGGRPWPQRVVAFWPALIPKDRVHTRVSVVET